jgi:uncharacterized protein
MSSLSGEFILQEKYNTRKRAISFYNNQMLDYLNPHMKEFIAEQDMVFISTADRAGNCDSSFRAGSQGFVRVIDDKTLLYPEYRGNGVMASLGNIYENPHIALMFIDFFEHSIGLHVNGKAAIIENDNLSVLGLSEEIMEDIALKEGNKPERWVLIEVEEAYIHCSKHIPKLQKADSEYDAEKEDKKQENPDFFKIKQK